MSSGLLMHIIICEKKLNRETHFDNIVKINYICNSIFIYDIDGWSANYKISQDLSLHIEFGEPLC